MLGRKAIQGALQRITAQSSPRDSRKGSLVKDTDSRERAQPPGLLLHWGNWSNGWHDSSVAP